VKFGPQSNKISTISSNKIPLLYSLDSIHSAAFISNSTLFPHEIGIAATFNTTIVYIGFSKFSLRNLSSFCCLDFFSRCRSKSWSSMVSNLGRLWWRSLFIGWDGICNGSWFLRIKSQRNWSISCFYNFKTLSWIWKSKLRKSPNSRYNSRIPFKRISFTSLSKIDRIECGDRSGQLRNN
jgi:hypothetical protein